MHFPSDDELMAGPNALEDLGLEFDDTAIEAYEISGTLPVKETDEAEEETAEAEEETAEAEEETTEAVEETTETEQDGLVKLDYTADFKAGFVAIVGRPNVGKSTLTNALVGSKIAITSMRPETTRHNVRGVVHGEDFQLVIVDTPGYHRPRTLLGRRLNEMVRESLAEVDVVVFCLPSDQKVGPGDEFIARQLRGLRTPVIAVATKADKVKPERMLEHLQDIDKLGEFVEIVPVSAHKNQQIDTLIKVLAERMPKSPPLYPRDIYSDEPRDVMIAELIREAALEGVRDELPHSLAVQVEEVVERKPKPGQKHPPMLNIHVNLFVERDSQKAIIIGKGGSRLKQVGTKARLAIEELLKRRVYLDLHVRTAKDWQSDPKMLGRLGF
ncbi:GTPase Era [Gleimia sp. 6138-11-ORH1]|uniref:GTPase Era n=1 Tax=Gleimia sp. 6138-11-ORH1 TaxID=2973937 RepID=UPI00216A9ABA|nr:GTPase Era [Gleimia sp. 6138-11-ORH1]MCS4484195.1 GTPase Era [Gleimia sp. 6138-11-ORH1]